VNPDPNIGAVERAMSELGDLADELLLIGGCAVGLLVTDPGATSVRATKDVDVLTEVTPLVNYYELCDRLKTRGFVEYQGDDVMCRWIKDGIMLDVVPTDGDILGFTNSWYQPAAKVPVIQNLPSGTVVRIISAPYFLATKLEAFASRGRGDYTHHDMEDIVTVVDGRESIVEEVLAGDEELRGFLRDEFEALLIESAFVDKLSWLLSPHEAVARQPILIERMRRIAGL